MSFHYANMPPASLLPKAVRPLLETYERCATAVAEHAFEIGQVTSDQAIADAQTADSRLMLEAIQAGAPDDKLLNIGRPAETLRAAKADAHRRAVQVSTVAALEAEAALITALVEHRDEIIAAARKALDAGAVRFAGLVDAMLAGRRDYSLDLEALTWALGIDGSRQLHGYGADPTPAFIGDFLEINESTMAVLLTGDARRHEALERAEERRAQMAADNARAEAMNRREFVGPVATPVVVMN